MRRGHIGISGWRNDNPNHFRPRAGGVPHFRPSRGYGQLQRSRYPPPGPRPYRNRPHVNSQELGDNHLNLEHHGQNTFRGGNYQQNQQRPPDRGQTFGQRQIFPLIQRMRHGDIPPDCNVSYHDTQHFYDNKQKNVCDVNKMGDADHRQQSKTAQKSDNYGQRMSSWANPHRYEERSYNKPFRHESGEHNKMPVPDYTGHRPPSSDHYGGNSLANDNSNAFNQSVDDTVNIVRKRLLSREFQHPADNQDTVQRKSDNKIHESVSEHQTNIQPEQSTKKKVIKQRNVKSNCDKIKNKIVHQLFMMDKDKIHKLMDNPNSSTKFEYAISSLVTESQNSFNRHLRSVAEKSLCSSSSDFIHNDNNTIYEDTFMKQMRCLLDPQDTVLLEDIKPIVLAELSKVLQLDDFDSKHELEEQRACNFPPTQDQQSEYNDYPDDTYNYENFESYGSAEDHELYYQQNQQAVAYEKTPIYKNESNRDYDHSSQSDFEPKQLFERRMIKKSPDYVQELSERVHMSSEDDSLRQDHKMFDDKPDQNKLRRSGTPIPLFDANAEQLSEDEDDPFAELDKQYHVAVDHTFIDNDDMVQDNFRGSPVIKKEIPNMTHKTNTPEKRPVSLVTPGTTPSIFTPLKIKDEIDSQLKDIAKSPLKFIAMQNSSELKSCAQMPTQEIDVSPLSNFCNTTMANKQFEIAEHNFDTNSINNDLPEQNDRLERRENPVMESLTSTNSRKRSVDQKPSHRKEKRKKSDPTLTEPNKQILNKNIIINVNDCASKPSEKCDVSKSVFNLFFAKEKSEKETPKNTKKNETSDIIPCEKHVKRKESKKKTKNIISENKKNHDSSALSYNTSPNTSNTSTTGHTPTKVENQTKLKTIDMFEEQPRRPSMHQAHRNTASTTSKTEDENKVKPFLHQSSRKLTKKNIARQVIKKCIAKETQTPQYKSTLATRFTQTEKRKPITRSTQTDSISTDPISKSTPKSTDVFDRMKEIDMEIQVLLQEKFKLYSSLESKESCHDNLSLGMTVVNLNTFNEQNSKQEEPHESTSSEDAVVNDFTSIPVEELEQIALESVQEDQHLNERRSRRLKLVKRDSQSTPSPTNITTRRSKSKTKTPNISLLEQIITDDRPLEDIISLDDLEGTPVKSTKNKTSKSKQKPKKKQRAMKPTKSMDIVVDYDIKECSVLIVKSDFSSYMLPKIESANLMETIVEVEENLIQPEINVVEETVDNDIQFDMLDVSEDIIIGDDCEVKCEERDCHYPSTMTICEEIILDNSQSSVEDVFVEPQNENECKTYDYSGDENLKRDSVSVTGHADAVLAIECIENNFIAACLDGNVYYFSGDGQLLSTLRGSNLAVTCLTIVNEKYGTIVYTGSLDSRIRYYDLETGLEKGPECNVLSPIQTMDRAWDTIFVGTRTGFVLQFECKNNMLIPVSTVKFSEQSILALRALKEGPRKVLLVAARSEAVTVKDAQTGLLLRTLEGPKMTVYTLLFEDGKVYCGTSSHQIHVFDYSSGTHVGSHEGGKGAVCLRATGGLLFAGCYDGCVYVYRESDPRPFAQLRGPGLMLLSLAVIGTKIIAGYKDRSLYIWKIPLSILQEMIL